MAGSLFFTVLARTKSLSAAARELEVEHVTVGRRDDALEKALGLRLVDRLSRSRPLTEEGRALAALAESMSTLATDIERLSRMASIDVAGTVKVSAPP
ncbi:LysR family transcriptional regulator [Pseudomonas sp.]|uniref:LysR family transcriptional regulator n=1 Tax=Pseudomonas sp. TaxID=306 RepID=UPI00262F14F2|nr:LysR family transcriptional regulator [Pseudomonas sp.]